MQIYNVPGVIIIMVSQISHRWFWWRSKCCNAETRQVYLQYTHMPHNWVTQFSWPALNLRYILWLSMRGGRETLHCVLPWGEQEGGSKPLQGDLTVSAPSNLKFMFSDTKQTERLQKHDQYPCSLVNVYDSGRYARERWWSVWNVC